MIKAIFWDNDGLLVDTEILYFKASAEILDQAGIGLSREEFIDSSLTRGESVFTLASARGFSPEQVEEMRLRRNARYGELLAEGVRVLPGVRESLKRLQGQISMAVVTSSLKEHFSIIHRHTGLLPYFDFILAREDYGRSKPDPEPYLKALRLSGLRAEECVAIEDSERGCIAAAAAGLRCWAIPGEWTAGGDFSMAERILGGVHEVPPILSFGTFR